MAHLPQAHQVFPLPDPCLPVAQALGPHEVTIMQGILCEKQMQSDLVDIRIGQSYTFGMKTAISLPERVFREAERFARRLRKSRSQLYAEAIAEYLARHAPNHITETMNAVCDRIGNGADDFQLKAARNMMSKESW
jgi:hypothetical protein